MAKKLYNLSCVKTKRKFWSRPENPEPPCAADGMYTLFGQMVFHPFGHWALALNVQGKCKFATLIPKTILFLNTRILGSLPGSRGIVGHLGKFDAQNKKVSMNLGKIRSHSPFLLDLHNICRNCFCILQPPVSWFFSHFSYPLVFFSCNAGRNLWESFLAGQISDSLGKPQEVV